MLAGASQSFVTSHITQKSVCSSLFCIDYQSADHRLLCHIFLALHSKNSSPNSSKRDKSSQGSDWGVRQIVFNKETVYSREIHLRDSGKRFRPQNSFFWWQRITRGISSLTVTTHSAKKLSLFFFFKYFTYPAVFNFFSNLESNQTSVKWTIPPHPPIKAEAPGKQTHRSVGPVVRSHLFSVPALM